MSRLLLATVICLMAVTAAAQVYRTTDAEGNVVFTDKPPADTAAEPVEIPPTNTSAPPPPRVVPPPAEEEPAAPVTTVTIVAPAHETSIPMGPGNFSVSAEVRPSLDDGEALQLFLDGEPRGEPQQGGNWDLTNVFRGAHELTVQVVDADGETVAQSQAVTVYVFRPSVLRTVD